MTPAPRESWHYKDLSPRNSQVNTQQRVAYRPNTTQHQYEPDYNQIQMGFSADVTYAEEGQNQEVNDGYNDNNQRLDSEQDLVTSTDGDQGVGLQANMSRCIG